LKHTVTFSTVRHATELLQNNGDTPHNRDVGSH